MTVENAATAAPAPVPQAAPAPVNAAPEPAPPSDPTERERVQAAISAMQSPAETTAEPDKPVATPAPELAKEPEPEKETPDDIVAAAGRERAAIRDTAAKLKEREAALEKELAQINSMRSAIKEDPIAFMDKHAGPNWYQDATKRFLNQGKPSQDEIVRTQAQEIAELRSQVQQIQQGVSMQPFERQAEQYLNSLGSAMARPEYAIIANDPDAVDKVNRLVVEHAQQTKGFLPIEDALGRVKAEQIERLRKLSQYTQAEQPAPAQVQAQQPNQSPAGTLTSKTQSPRATPPVESEEDDFDAEARRRRAVAALTGGTASGN